MDPFQNPMSPPHTGPPSTVLYPTHCQPNLSTSVSAQGSPAQGPVPGLPGATHSHPPRAMPGGRMRMPTFPTDWVLRARTWQALSKQCWVKGDGSAKRPHARHKPWSTPGALRETGGQSGTRCASERQLEWVEADCPKGEQGLRMSQSQVLWAEDSLPPHPCLLFSTCHLSQSHPPR